MKKVKKKLHKDNKKARIKTIYSTTNDYLITDFISSIKGKKQHPKITK